MSGENDGVELSDDDKRTLKQLAADVRDSSVTRRAAMGGTAALLGAGAFGAGRVSADASTSDSDGDVGQPGDRVDVFADGVDADELVGVPVVGDGDTIQTAHDDLPSTGGQVYVTSDYDDSQESFPVNITKPISIQGESAQSVRLDAGSNVAFDVDGASNYVGVRLGYFELRDISIVGGQRGIDIQNAAFSRIQDVTVDGVTDHGIFFISDTNSTNSALLKRVEVVNCGTDGIRTATGSDSHALMLLNCTVDKNGGEGLHARDGRAVTIIGGQYQQNGSRGIRMDGGSAFMFGPYIEENDSSNTTDVLITGGQGHVVWSAYCNGNTDNSNAILINGGSGHHINNLVGTGYTAGLISTASGSDSDLHLNSHTALDTSPIFDSSGATRDRSDGVIGAHHLGGVDLSSTTGQFEGDRAIADGTATGVSAGDLARWDSANSQWDVWNADATV